MEYGATPGRFWQFLVCSYLALPRCTAIFSLEERVLVARKDFQGCETEVLATLSLHCNAWRGGVRAVWDEGLRMYFRLAVRKVCSLVRRVCISKNQCPDHQADVPNELLDTTPTTSRTALS
jgi:hypothetical protein